MLLLEYNNLLLKSVLTERLIEEPDNHIYIDQIVSDFDNTTFHISTPDDNDLSKIVVSIYIKCYNDLKKYGSDELFERYYGEYQTTPENGYNYSISIDLNNLPANLEDRSNLIEQISLMKRNVLAAPFELAFNKFDELAVDAQQRSLDLYAPEESKTDVMAIHYRDEEAIFIKPSYDRVTVIFSTIFRDETDRVFGKVFLQEFVDARRRAIQNAPQVLYSHREPPAEIKGLVPESSNIGYVTFVLFPRHMHAQRRENCISHIQLFRDYFHYHIKCSKAYMHSRMRYRVSSFLKVLNRAKPENVEKERKTATGRRFVSGN